MTIALGITALVSAYAVVWLLAAGGWPAWAGLFVATVLFGGDPAEPGQAALFGAATFIALSFVGRAAETQEGGGRPKGRPPPERPRPLQADPSAALRDLLERLGQNALGLRQSTSSSRWRPPRR